MDHFLFVVEGPHDVEFTGRLLQHLGFTRLRKKSEIDAFWNNAIPTKFPFADDLEERMPVPVFFADENRSVAVKGAVGIGKLVSEALETNKVLGGGLDGIGFLFDADTSMAAVQYRNLAQLVNEKLGITLPVTPGQVTTTNPRYGGFVFPDNVTPGTLENVLAECAQLSYKRLMSQARKFVGDVNRAELTPAEEKGLNKPAGITKAALCCVATVLKPAQSIYASIRSDRWLNDNSMELPVVKSALGFVSGIVN